ncbi:MAG: ATP-binding cassette domain-containing protein, partial [Gemmatimonadales bacterium]
QARTDRPVILRANGLSVHYGSVAAVRDVDLTLCAGEVTALLGRNGSGKSSLLWSLQGSGVRSGGTVRIDDPTDAAAPQRRNPGVDPRLLPPDESIAWIALVPQNPSELLYLDSVQAECNAADRIAQAAPGTTARLLERLAPGVPESRDPRDVSEGERLALVLAVQLAGRPRVLLLDEPTRGLDYAAKRRFGQVLTELAATGTAVLLSCHDVEFVARCADRIVVLAGGELLTQGSALEVLTASPSLAPQVARILHPLPLLTVDAVRDRLAGAL